MNQCNGSGKMANAALDQCIGSGRRGQDAEHKEELRISRMREKFRRQQEYERRMDEFMARNADRKAKN